LRIRNQEELVPVQFAPAAGVTISKLDEKDGAVEFVLPGAGLDLVLPFVDLDERPSPGYCLFLERSAG
jgi:hypothetical protein